MPRLCFLDTTTILASLTLVFLFTQPGYAQPIGSLAGIVSDSVGGALADVTVTLSGPAWRTTRTDAAA